MAVRVLSKGEQTRERILEIAEDAVLHKGFAGTSLDEIICEAGITKSGFFYHFKDKNDLAKALLQRYLDNEWSVFDQLFRQADELSDDPLHGFLVALKLFAEMMANLPEVHPGCLAASFCYQDQLFNREIHELNAGGLLRWRELFRARLDAEFPELSILEFDLDEDRERITAAGYVSKLIPLFVVPREDGYASEQRFEGGVKGDRAVANIIPRLRRLLSR